MNATRRRLKWRNDLRCYLWLLPFFALFFVFFVYPFFNGIYIGLTEWSGFAPPSFIGMKNYRQLFHDHLFWYSLGNTCVIWLLIVPLRSLIGLIMAAVVNAPFIKRKGFFLFLFLLPNVTAIVVVAILFRIVLSSHGGIVNDALQSVFGFQIHWLDSVFWSKPSIAILNLWMSSGYFAIILLAGLQQIPRQLYEAAEIDGAGAVRRFYSITLPLMWNVLFFVVLISTIWIFQNIGDALVLTQGGPQYSSTPLVYYMYLNAFQNGNLGYASAISTVLFVLLAAISLIMFSINRKIETARG